MEIDKTSDEWKRAPLLVRFSALGTNNSRALGRWSGVMVVLAIVVFCLSLFGHSSHYPAFVFLLGAYCNKSAELWVERHLSAG